MQDGGCRKSRPRRPHRHRCLVAEVRRGTDRGILDVTGPEPPCTGHPLWTRQVSRSPRTSPRGGGGARTATRTERRLDLAVRQIHLGSCAERHGETWSDGKSSRPGARGLRRGGGRGARSHAPTAASIPSSCRRIAGIYGPPRAAPERKTRTERDEVEVEEAYYSGFR